MRVLVASTRPRPAADRLAAFARRLAARGHEVTWAAPGEPIDPAIPALTPRSARHPERIAGLLALRIARELVVRRPHVALLRWSPGIAATTSFLRAARVPIVLDADDLRRAPDGLPPEGERAALQVSLRMAAQVCASSEQAAERAMKAGARHVTVVPDPRPLPALLPGTRADARAALDLPLDHPIVAHTGILDRSARLEWLAEAHRHAAGVGLLVIEHGPRNAFAHAMTMSTRPSSPVLVLTHEAAPVALWAADALVWLGDTRDQAATDPLALGRRVVLAERDAHLEAAYPAHLDVVQVPADNSPRALLEAIQRALHAERAHGPLTQELVLRARAHLDRPEQLLAVLEDARKRRR